MFVIRRISAHIRRDATLWTVLFFSDPHVSLDHAHYEADVPGRAQPLPEVWLTDWIRETSPPDLIKDLGKDGFGFVLRLLREIKGTWKLLLNEMEIFLEDMIEAVSDEELMESANWLHRKFLSNIDYFERQLLYHSRYVHYITHTPPRPGLFINPTIFQDDLLQESSALSVMDQRLGVLKARTTAVLETVVSLMAVKQARLASSMMEIQMKDAQLSYSQNESIRRLTIVNMVYLPATFIAVSTEYISTLI